MQKNIGWYKTDKKIITLSCQAAHYTPMQFLLILLHWLLDFNPLFHRQHRDKWDGMGIGTGEGLKSRNIFFLCS